MILQDAFCESLKESMDEISNLEETISICDDLAMDDAIFEEGFYLTEALDNLFPVDDISKERLSKLEY